jgi:hypothetical protein
VSRKGEGEGLEKEDRKRQRKVMVKRREVSHFKECLEKDVLTREMGIMDEKS